MGKIEDYFMGKLADEDKKYCDEWANLRLDLAEIHDFALFDYGFCLGAQLMGDVFLGIDDSQRISSNYENTDEK